MGNYQEDLKREAKNWIPYIKCESEQEYYNQELKILSFVKELLNEKCIYNLYSNKQLDENKNFLISLDNRQYHKGLLFSLYADRCLRKDIDEQRIYSNLRTALKEYSYEKDTDLEMFLTKNIPINYLTSYEALNVLGLDWCLDSNKEGYKKCVNDASVYIYEMCYDKFAFCDKEDVAQLIEKMIKELNIYKPEGQKLGSFISSRMKNRMNDVWRIKSGQKVSKRKIPKTAEIMIKEDMIWDTIYIADMEKVAVHSDLQKGKYVIGKDRLYFSEEDIGKEVRIKYIEDKGIKEKQLKEKQRNQKVEDGEMERFLVLIASRILNYEEACNSSGTRIETQRERRHLCFTEKLVYSVKNYGYDENNLEVDAKKVLNSEYLDFFMAEPNLVNREFFLDDLEEVPLKRNCDILNEENNKELKWTKKKWLEAKVPKSYFLRKDIKVANATITEFRQAYDKWLYFNIKERKFIKEKF